MKILNLQNFIVVLILSLIPVKSLIAESMRGHESLSNPIEEQILACKSQSVTSGHQSDPLNQSDLSEITQNCQACCDLQFAYEFSPWNQCHETCIDINSNNFTEN